jgi:hypothetical protein
MFCEVVSNGFVSVVEENDEPRWLFDLEIHGGLGAQVPDFPRNRHSADEERTAAQVGGAHSQVSGIVINV